MMHRFFVGFLISGLNYVFRENEVEYLKLAALERQRNEHEKMSLEDQLADVSIYREYSR